MMKHTARKSRKTYEKELLACCKEISRDTSCVLRCALLAKHQFLTFWELLKLNWLCRVATVKRKTAPVAQLDYHAQAVMLRKLSKE